MKYDIRKIPRSELYAILGIACLFLSLVALSFHAAAGLGLFFGGLLLFNKALSHTELELEKRMEDEKDN